MPKITSIDALVVRIKEVRPNMDEAVVDEIRQLMAAKDYSRVYDNWLSRSYCVPYEDSVFFWHQVLETVDDEGNVIKDRFAALIAKAKAIQDEISLEGLRGRLKRDFLRTYPVQIAYD